MSTQEGVTLPEFERLPDGSRFSRAAYPHLTDEEWMTLHRMSSSYGVLFVAGILRLDRHEQQQAIQEFLHRMRADRERVAEAAREQERQSLSTQIALAQQAERRQAEQQRAEQYPRRQTVKLDPSVYKGTEGENLRLWFLEVETAIEARMITDPRLQMAFAMSFLGERPKAWAYGKKLVENDTFATYNDLKVGLEMAFQPPRSEFRSRAKFLHLRQGKRSLHSYVQEVRLLIASITGEPVDVQTQISVFLNGLEPGPIRTQLFREQHATLEETIQSALNEDFSLRQSKLYNGHQGGYPKPFPKRHGTGSSGPTPMDLSSADAKSRTHAEANAAATTSHSKKTSKCNRCGKMGHYSFECLAPAPVNGAGSFLKNERKPWPKNGSRQ